MQEQRLFFLEQYFREEPHEPFNGYALAMEYLSTDTPKALELFEMLYREHPDYLPTYYQLAKLYLESAAYSKAEEVYLKGMDLARQQSNSKTEKELKGAYQILKDETEEW